MSEDLVVIDACFYRVLHSFPRGGQEAVLTIKPYVFGHGGVDPTPITAGARWVAISTHADYVSKQPLQASVHFEDLMSLDGVPLDFDVVIRLQVTDSVTLIRELWTQMVRKQHPGGISKPRATGGAKHGMNETAISTKAIEEIDDEATKSMETYLQSIKFPARLIQVTFRKANPPDSVKNQRIQAASEQQRQETERHKKLAEDQRKEAERSRASADNAYREAMQLPPEQFIRLEAINKQKEVCHRSNCTFIVGSVSPVIDVKR